MSAQSARLPDDDPARDAEIRDAYARGVLDGTVWTFLSTMAMLLALTALWWMVGR